MTVGYSQDPRQILARRFEAQYDEMIICPWIEFHSTCEHHLLPFFGVAHVGYIPSAPDSKVVGLSKLARLVDCFARRLQIQEQMTQQIASAMQEHLDPRGVAVVVQAKHLCMACRGVQKHKAAMVTSAMRGVFLQYAPRVEFFKLIELAHKSNEQ
jgi:GTP cyclohydrolase I